MVIISKFRLIFKNGIYKVVSFESPRCSKCDTTLRYIDTRKRVMINESGDRISLRIRRLRCDVCKTIHSELPDILVPNHLYCYAIIEKVYLMNKDLTPVDDGTYRRIKKYVELISKYTNPIVSIELKDMIRSYICR